MINLEVYYLLLPTTWFYHFLEPEGVTFLSVPLRICLLPFKAISSATVSFLRHGLHYASMMSCAKSCKVHFSNPQKWYTCPLHQVLPKDKACSTCSPSHMKIYKNNPAAPFFCELHTIYHMDGPLQSPSQWQIPAGPAAPGGRHGGTSAWKSYP